MEVSKKHENAVRQAIANGEDPLQVMKNGGWIQKAINPEHKGYCTPMTKSTCTPKRKALAKTFKKHHGFHKKKDGGKIYEDGGLIKYEPGGITGYDANGHPIIDDMTSAQPTQLPNTQNQQLGSLNPNDYSQMAKPKYQSVYTPIPFGQDSFAGAANSLNAGLSTNDPKKQAGYFIDAAKEGLVSGAQYIGNDINNRKVNAYENNQSYNQLTGNNRTAYSPYQSNDYRGQMQNPLQSKWGGNLMKYQDGGEQPMTANDYVTPRQDASAEIEGGEGVSTNDGVVDNVTGASHDNGGIPTNMEGKIFSKDKQIDKDELLNHLQTLPDNGFALNKVMEEIGNKKKYKFTPANLVKAFDTTDQLKDIAKFEKKGEKIEKSEKEDKYTDKYTKNANKLNQEGYQKEIQGLQQEVQQNQFAADNGIYPIQEMTKMQGKWGKKAQKQAIEENSTQNAKFGGKVNKKYAFGGKPKGRDYTKEYENTQNADVAQGNNNLYPGQIIPQLQPINNQVIGNPNYTSPYMNQGNTDAWGNSLTQFGDLNYKTPTNHVFQTLTRAPYDPQSSASYEGLSPVQMKQRYDNARENTGEYFPNTQLPAGLDKSSVLGLQAAQGINSSGAIIDAYKNGFLGFNNAHKAILQKAGIKNPKDADYERLSNEQIVKGHMDNLPGEDLVKYATLKFTDPEKYKHYIEQEGRHVGNGLYIDKDYQKDPKEAPTYYKLDISGMKPEDVQKIQGDKAGTTNVGKFQSQAQEKRGYPGFIPIPALNNYAIDPIQKFSADPQLINYRPTDIQESINQGTRGLRGLSKQLTTSPTSVGNLQQGYGNYLNYLNQVNGENFNRNQQGNLAVDERNAQAIYQNQLQNNQYSATHQDLQQRRDAAVNTQIRTDAQGTLQNAFKQMGDAELRDYVSKTFHPTQGANSAKKWSEPDENGRMVEYSQEVDAPRKKAKYGGKIKTKLKPKLKKSLK